MGTALVRRVMAAATNPCTGWILKAWQTTLNGFVECRRLLCAAKKDWDHGKFLAMVEKDLPFGPRMAQKLEPTKNDACGMARHFSTETRVTPQQGAQHGEPTSTLFLACWST
jgi:hypothetical protein